MINPNEKYDNVVKHPRYDLGEMEYNAMRCELDYARVQVEKLTELIDELYKKLGKTLQKIEEKQC
jgi:hypothetical protein